MEQKYLLLNEGEVIKWQGLWSAEKEIYAIGDVVAHAKTGYGTCVYKAIVGHVPEAATEPEVGASWETVWEVFLMGGQNGTGAGTGDVIAAGKAGGQTINGGTGASENLELASTSHETVGKIYLGESGANRFCFSFGPYPALQVLDSTGNVVNQLIFAPAVGGIDYDFLASTGFFAIRNSINGSDAFSVDADGDVTMVRDCAIGRDCSITGKLALSGPFKPDQLAKTANYTITDTDPDIVVVGALGAHATITLPTVADNAGRIITVIIGGNPGVYNCIVDGEGAETINGAATKTNSDQYSYLRLLSTGSVWLIIGSSGTWT